MTDNNYITASNPKFNVWVSASAGSGKTKSLTDRYLRFLLNGVTPDKILCLTFTKIAAAEMLTRIKNTLGEWSILSEQELKSELEKLSGEKPTATIYARAKKLFNEFVNCQDKLQIQTIHSFCQKLLRRFPIESGIKMNTTLITDQQKSILIEKAKNTFLQHYENDLENPNFLNYLLENIHENTLDSIIERAVYISSISDLVDKKDDYTSKISALLNFRIETYEKEKEELISTLQHTINHYHNILVTINTEEPIISIVETLNFIEQKGENIENLKAAFLTKEGLPRSSLLKKKLLTSNPPIASALQSIQKIVVDYNNLEVSKKTFKLTQGFLDLAYLFEKHFTKIKNHSNSIDYNDLIKNTLNLLKNKTLKDWVESKLNQKISHIMVDESQDVNLKQWQIIHACLKDFFSANDNIPNTIFVVGDQKQSIYSFQGSSPELFNGINAFISDTAKSFESELLDINFNTSFRSDALILNFIDNVFSKINTQNNHFFCEKKLKHTASKKFAHSSVEVWPLITGEEKLPKDKDSYEWQITDDYENKYNPPKVLAKMIARKINHSIENKLFNPSDFMILVRKRDVLSNYIVQELKHLSIPVSGLDRLILNDHIVVKDLISLIQFILLPADDYNLACLLKSPIFSISEDQLFEISQRDEKTIWENIEILSKKNDDDIKKLYIELEYILNNTDIQSPYALMIHFLDYKGYRKKILSRLGIHTNEIIDELTNICLEFEESGDKSLISFLNWFNSSKIEIKKEISSEAEEVKIMTIHGAKGLQAKFVILPDTVSIPKNKDNVLFDQLNDTILYNVPENQNTSYKKIVEELKLSTVQEYYRLLYVGLTRASEHLLICGHTTSEIPDLSWYNIIHSTISDIGQKYSCKDLYGYKIVDKIEHDTECFISNSHEIFKIEQGVPSKHIKSYSKESRKRPIPAFLFEHYVDKSALYTSSPSEKLQQKTQETEYAINVGKLTHKILEYFVPMKRIINKNEVKDFIEIYKENAALKFTTKQINNICVLANDYLLPIAKNGELKTELKIKRRYKLNNNHYIMSGIIDLLILTDKEAHIIDYKTDKIVPDTHLDIELKYLKQMCSYKEMISNIYTDHKIICHLAWTHKPTLIKIEESQLETKDLEST